MHRLFERPIFHLMVKTHRGDSNGWTHALHRILWDHKGFRNLHPTKRRDLKEKHIIFHELEKIQHEEFDEWSIFVSCSHLFLLRLLNKGVFIGPFLVVDVLKVHGSKIQTKDVTIQEPCGYFLSISRYFWHNPVFQRPPLQGRSGLKQFITNKKKHSNFCLRNF